MNNYLYIRLNSEKTLAILKYC